MTKEQIEKKAREISYSYYMPDTGFDRNYLYEAALEMAKWILQNIQIVRLKGRYNPVFFKHKRSQYLEEQKNNLLLSLKGYIEVDEMINDYGIVVKTEIKIMK